MPRTQAWLALAVSLGLHAVPLTHALGDQRSAVSRRAPADRVVEAPAVLPGETFDIDAVAAEPAAPAPAAPALPRPAPGRAPGATPPTAGARAPVSATSGSGTYGEESALVAAASLGKGLLRVLPRVSYPVTRFHQLPVGATVVTSFSVDLDDSGHVTKPPRFDGERVSEPWFDALVVRALLLLRAGTFAQPASRLGRLEHDFELEAEVVQGEPRTGDWLEPRDLAEIGRLVEPTAHEPGRAHFVYNSGREVRLALKLVPRK